MNTLPFLLILLTGSPSATTLQGGDYTALKREAEKLYAEGSYELAHRRYEGARRLDLSDEQERWVRFRLADTRWRSSASTQENDASVFEQPRAELTELAAPETRNEDRDLVWAEANESLGDFHWDRTNSRQWHPAWNHYQLALDWWAGAEDVETARGRYLGIVWRVTDPSWAGGNSRYGNYGSYLGPEILRNAVRIAERPQDKSRAHYLLGLHFYNQGRQPRSAGRALEEFEASLEIGREADWYDDALFHYGRFLEDSGRAEFVDGAWIWTPDYVEAVAVYRRLIREFDEGESSYWRQARRRIEDLTGAQLHVWVDRFFLPGSEVQYNLKWRNNTKIELTLYRTDLTRDLRFENEMPPGSFLQAIDVRRLESHRKWTYETGDEGKHEPGHAQLSLEEKLPLGAWLLEAKAGANNVRALVLVSDAGLTVKASGDEILAWLTDMNTGRPLAGADLALWQRYYDKGTYRWKEARAKTNDDGTVVFQVPDDARQVDYFLAAKSPDEKGANRQAYAHHSSAQRQDPAKGWRIYAYTDRPAYRPGDEVRWKYVARRQEDSVYETPAGETVEWDIVDPLGATVGQGSSKLNAWGAASAELELTDTMPLGEYTVRFHTKVEKSKNTVGSAKLFRLEEYKAPEFLVSVETAKDAETERPKIQVLGDTVEADIEATYLFGAPVAGAKVEVFVHQKPYYRVWRKERDFPWFYEEQNDMRWWGGQGQQVLHETLETDAAGRAKVFFDTPIDGGQDFEYTIEARVVDASRREIIGSGAVRVTQTEYSARVEAKHAIHRPGAPVEVTFTTLDANENPVSAKGQVTVTRQTWVEVWMSPEGREVTGRALEGVRRKERIFPPPTKPGERPWYPVRQGYESEVVVEESVSTGPVGTLAWRFSPKRDGTYRVAWVGVDSRKREVRAEARVFVATEATRELGYLPGGVEIILDRDTVRAGEQATILLSAASSNRWVLFTVEGEELLHHQVVHLEGTVKLVRLPIGEAHIPNAYLTATMIAGGEAFRDFEDIVVPPVEQFLDVDLAFDAESYQPGEKGTLSITVRDHEGQPVSVDLGVAVSDDALSYIQGDYAGDPRQFFYGTRKPHRVNSYGSFFHMSYVRLVERDGQLVDYRQAWREDAKNGPYGGYLADGPVTESASTRGLRKEKRESLGQVRALGYAESDDFFLGAQLESSSRPLAPAAAVPRQQNLQAGVGAPAVRVRSDFRDTAAWEPSLTTNAQGRASVEVPFPDNTTRWKAVVRAAGADARFGWGSGEVRTRQPLIATLQAPRFFQVGDQAVVSGLLHNNTDEDMALTVAFAAEGLVLEDSSASELELVVAAGAQERLDWRVSVVEPGEALLRLTAAGSAHSDGIERRLPIHDHGIEAFVATSGRFDGDEIRFQVELPADRQKETTALDVQITPSMAVTMLDALPYLADYPYGCTEQTLSRFLPSAIVAKTLRDFGLSPEEAMSRVFGGIEREFVDKTHAGEEKALERLDAMVADGLARLYDYQHPDGGWGWWKKDNSEPFMTAYVLWGLSLARDAGIDVRAGVMQNAAAWLVVRLVEEENQLDRQAWILHALTAYGADTGRVKGQEFIDKAFGNLWTKRTQLNSYSRSLLTLSAVALERDDEARVLADNLINGVKVDDSPDTSVVMVGDQQSQPYVLKTAHWGEDKIWRRWSEGGVEATSFALRALLAVDPEHELVDPVTNWLIKNRRGAQWSNTRDTAITVLALNDYLKKSGELAQGVSYELIVNGRSRATLTLTKDELLRAPSVFRIEPDWIRDGANEILIKKSESEGALYFAAHASFYSLEEPIPARGSEIFVRREYYKLVGRPTLLKGLVYDRERLNDGDSVESGERVEVILTVEAKNNLEYLVFEDLKPAGFEAVQVRSGERMLANQLQKGAVSARFAEDDEAQRRRTGAPRGAFVVRPGRGYTGSSRGVHQELRDRKVALFVSELPEGVWEMRYDLRAEVPGSFHALPVLGYAMYVPEIRCNSEEIRVSVTEGEQAD